MIIFGNLASHTMSYSLQRLNLILLLRQLSDTLFQFWV